MFNIDQDGPVDTNIILRGLKNLHRIIKYSPTGRFAMLCINHVKRKSNIDQDRWVNTGIFLRGMEDFDRTIEYSPTGRFAMICINPVYKGIQKSRIEKIVFLNLFNNKLSRTLVVEKGINIRYRYWLSDDMITFFYQDRRARHYVQSVYNYNLNDPSFSKPILINKRIIPFLSSNIENARIILSSMSASKIAIKGHDFLLVKSAEYVLCSFDIAEIGPLLPPFKMNIIEEIGTTRYISSSKGFVFAYKDILYYCVYEGHRLCTDRFFEVKLTDFDIDRGEIVVDQNTSDESKLFIPKKLNDGVYGSFFLAWCLIWQDGCMVLITNTCVEIEEKDRIVWILNLEKATIMEVIISGYKFNYATLYKGFLQLWGKSASKNRQLRTKFVFMNDHVPRLSDLCMINLISHQQHVAI